MVTTAAAFRAYGSRAASLDDYVALLRNDTRYAGALGRGSDVQGFGAALQSAGYATDPDYAKKLTAVAHQVGTLLLASTAPSDNSLKFSTAQPITSGAGTASGDNA